MSTAHRTDLGELQSLLQAGIASIDVRHTTLPEVQNGNLLLERSTVTLTDGRRVEVIDVYFRVDGKDEGEATDVGPKANDQLPSAAPDRPYLTRPLGAYHERPHSDNEIRFRPAAGMQHPAPTPRPAKPAKIVIPSRSGQQTPAPQGSDNARDERQVAREARIDWRESRPDAADDGTVTKSQHHAHWSHPKPLQALWVRKALAQQDEEEKILSETTGLKIELSREFKKMH